MERRQSILVLSDIHFAGPAEVQRGCPEIQLAENVLIRWLIWSYRHYVWRRDPFAHNATLQTFLRHATGVDYVIANGDFSCDTAFVGISDDAALESAQLCVQQLRDRFGQRLRLVTGDHELGKTSLVGGRGGMRLQSWSRLESGLGLEPFWTLPLGRYLLLGVTSSLVALPVFEPDTLPDERTEWDRLRRQHLDSIREAFARLEPGSRVILFCHDPTALPFLLREEVVRARLGQIEATIIGHLHSPLFLWKSRLLSGMPVIPFAGRAIRRMSTALREARIWPQFRVTLCPALAGIELLKDGGYLRLMLDPAGAHALEIERRPLGQAAKA